MPSKSLKTTFKLPSTGLNEAIVYLSERFLREARGVRMVKAPNEFCLLTLCRPLVDRWFTGQLPYKPGQITRIFHADALSSAADILMYVPKQGDRFLYTKPHLDPPGAPEEIPGPGETSESVGITRLADEIDRLAQQQRQLQKTVAEAVAASPVEQGAAPLPASQNALVGALSQAFQSSSRPMLSAIAQLTNRIQQLEAAVQAGQSDSDRTRGKARSGANDASNSASSSTPNSAIAQRLEAIAQQISSQQDALQTQMEQMVAQLTAQLGALGDATPPVPQTDEEWRSRLERTWGTVGDYETYSTAYREIHADAPLFETPDWVMLCEFDWAQRLCPTLADLQALLYGPNGVGDEGADILQQFGAHRRGAGRGADRYYLYQERGYTAETALQEIAHHPDYAWLPTLRKLWQALKTPTHKIFKLFGWEDAAVAALKGLAEPPRRQDYGNGSYSNQSGQRTYGSANPSDAGRWQASPSGPSLQDYQALLNIGPFAPLTAETVKRAYRQAMKKAHPDSGGSTQQAQQINEAYRAVMHHYFPGKS